MRNSHPCGNCTYGWIVVCWSLFVGRKGIVNNRLILEVIIDYETKMMVRSEWRLMVGNESSDQLIRCARWLINLFDTIRVL